MHTTSSVVSENAFEGIQAQSSTGGMNRMLELDLTQIKNQSYDLKPGKVYKDDDRYLAEMMQPTCSGQFVNCSYTLSVEAQYDVTCSEIPRVTIPLTITPAPVPSFGQVQAPTGWAPVVYDTY